MEEMQYNIKESLRVTKIKNKSINGQKLTFNDMYFVDFYKS